jgi:sugar phosphate isomerase/epimerase
MKLGAMNSPSTDVLSELKSLSSLGFDYVELTVEKPMSSPETLRTIKDEAVVLTRSLGIELLGHVPWRFELGHPYHQSIGVAQVHARRIEEAVKICHELGIRKITVHPPTLTSATRRSEGRRVLRQFEEAADIFVSTAKDLGCTVLVENLDEEAFTMSDFEELFSEVPELGFTLDIGHASIGKLENNSLEYLRRFRDRLRHIHISDNLGGYGDLHLPLGAGMIDYGKILREIRAIGYDETITLEVFSQDRTYLKLSREKTEQALGLHVEQTVGCNREQRKEQVSSGERRTA